MSDYEFSASGDACGICQALDGTDASAPAHEHCQCQNVPAYGCETKVENLASVPIGPDGGSRFSFGGEVTVICANGTELGMSVGLELDVSSGSEWAFAEALDAAADELCAQCPDDEPPNVS